MARVVVYERAGCHLCDVARPIVDEVCAEFALAARYVDVDLVDDELCNTLTDLVPCVYVDGAQLTFWRVDPVQLRAALAAKTRS